MRAGEILNIDGTTLVVGSLAMVNEARLGGDSG
jgi:hypothetical protein